MPAPSFGHHLWVKPHGEAYQRLSDAIVALAERLDAPVFEPHVTLLGAVPGSEAEIVRRVKELVGEVQPFEVALTGPAWGDSYFQCVFLLAESPALRVLHHAARRLFGTERQTPGFMPHLSLVYGDLSAERKQQIVEHVPVRCPMTFEVDAVTVIRAESRAPGTWDEVADVGLLR